MNSLGSQCTGSRRPHRGQATKGRCGIAARVNDWPHAHVMSFMPLSLRFPSLAAGALVAGASQPPSSGPEPAPQAPVELHSLLPIDTTIIPPRRVG